MAQYHLQQYLNILISLQYGYSLNICFYKLWQLMSTGTSISLLKHSLPYLLTLLLLTLSNIQLIFQILNLTFIIPPCYNSFSLWSMNESINRYLLSRLLNNSIFYFTTSLYCSVFSWSPIFIILMINYYSLSVSL